MLPCDTLHQLPFVSECEPRLDDLLRLKICTAVTVTACEDCVGYLLAATAIYCLDSALFRHSTQLLISRAVSLTRNLDRPLAQQGRSAVSTDRSNAVYGCSTCNEAAPQRLAKVRGRRAGIHAR